MLIKYLLATLLLFGLATQSANASDGNQLLKECNKALLYLDGDNKNMSVPDMVEASYCLGQMQGANSMNTLYRAINKDKALYCSPKNLAPGQTVRIVVKYMKEHPEDLHEESIVLVAAALQAVYPCQ